MMINRIKSGTDRYFFLRLFWAVLFIARFVPAQEVSSLADQDRPVRILGLPADFSGWVGPEVEEKDLQEIKLGFFMPEQPDNQVLDAANLAISEINNAGGYHGLPFRLITRWATDPWGAGSKELIKLIYRDSVWAIIGSVDGNATHIAEQIVTKAWVPLITPVSADPTLNYINIPWIFRLPPDFSSQSQLLVDKGIKRRPLSRIGLITSDDHDGRTFSEEMLEALQENNCIPLFHFELPVSLFDTGKIISKVLEFSPDGLVIHLTPQHLLSLVSGLNEKQYKLICLIPWIPDLDLEALSKNTNINFCFVEPFSTGKNTLYYLFAERYFDNYGQYPGADAAYTYDAVYIIAAALRHSGLNRAKLRKIISQLTAFNGVTGEINWDNGGGNSALPIVHILKNW